MRRIAPAFVYEQLRVLLNQLDILACEPDRVPYASALEALQMSARGEVAEKILCDWFCAPPLPTGVPNTVALAMPEVARFVGIHRLRQAKVRRRAHQRLPLRTFMEEWAHALGTCGSEAQLSLLHGFFLLDPPPASFTSSTPSTDLSPGMLVSALSIEFFPHTQLPLTPAQRFQDLFLLRTQWVREELLPFLHDLAGSAPDAKKKATIEGLLAKHARTSRARWSRVHGQVLLRGELDEGGTRASGAEECTLYQARVRY